MTLSIFLLILLSTEALFLGDADMDFSSMHLIRSQISSAALIIPLSMQYVYFVFEFICINDGKTQSEHYFPFLS